MSVLVQGKRNSAQDLEMFSRRIETMLRKGGATDSVERLICRLLTQKKSPAVASFLVSKWVEWRYGNAKQSITGDIKITVEHIGTQDKAPAKTD